MNHKKIALSNTIGSTYRATLSTSIQEEYNKLIGLITSIPSDSYEKKVMEGTGGLVSCADIISYQIGWGTLLIGWYKAGISGKMPEMPGAGFLSWDYEGLAKHFYKQYHDTRDKQLEHFKQIVEEIIVTVEHEYARGNLDASGIWQWCTLKSGKQWPLSKWVQVNTVAPYKRATGLIRRSALWKH